MDEAQSLSTRARSRCLQIAIPVSGMDLLSKEIASQWRVDTLVFNTSTRVTFGAEQGLPAWTGDVIVGAGTMVLALCVVRALAALDRRATTALGLIAGGTIGNLASLLAGPAGVADFLGVPLTSSYAIIANGADLALWSGTLLLVPVLRTLISALVQKPM